MWTYCPENGLEAIVWASHIWAVGPNRPFCGSTFHYEKCLLQNKMQHYVAKASVSVVLDGAVYNTQIFTSSMQQISCTEVSNCKKSHEIFHPCLRTWWSITTHVRAHHCLLSWARRIHFTLRHYIYSLYQFKWNPGYLSLAMSHGLDALSSIPGRGKRFFCIPQLSDRLWGPPILLCKGSWNIFPRV
jgi:hypothetical protein